MPSVPPPQPRPRRNSNTSTISPMPIRVMPIRDSSVPSLVPSPDSSPIPAHRNNPSPRTPDASPRPSTTPIPTTPPKSIEFLKSISSDSLTGCLKSNSAYNDAFETNTITTFAESESTGSNSTQATAYPPVNTGESSRSNDSLLTTNDTAPGTAPTHTGTVTTAPTTTPSTGTGTATAPTAPPTPKLTILTTIHSNNSSASSASFATPKSSADGPLKPISFPDSPFPDSPIPDSPALSLSALSPLSLTLSQSDPGLDKISQEIGHPDSHISLPHSQSGPLLLQSQSLPPHSQSHSRVLAPLSQPHLPPLQPLSEALSLPPLETKPESPIFSFLNSQVPSEPINLADSQPKKSRYFICAHVNMQRPGGSAADLHCVDPLLQVLAKLLE
ncbi:hypothetical protein B484DRAFT_454878 [Ochromonadaceae sp. CCMP2298]|nr:hypothetical protein B484DRAFT_454878 [Ochromonadaceae sp. CCMP2298]